MDNPPPPAPTTPNPSNKDKRVLVVEDDSMIRDLYTEILKAEGYNVEEAEDGETAYTKIVAGGYDLVLLDIMLPKMDGVTILTKLNKDTPPQKPNGPIVVLSNLGQDSVIASAVNNGARGYMIKSDLTPDQVLAEVHRYLSET